MNPTIRPSLWAFLCALLLLATAASLQASNVLTFPEGGLFLVPECPIAHTDNGYHLLDAEPFWHEDQLLVPLRFVAETLNAVMHYEHGKISLWYPNRCVILQPDSTVAFDTKRIVSLDFAPLLYQERTYVSLPVLSQVLNTPVFYDDGILIIGIIASNTDASSWPSWKEAIETRYVTIGSKMETVEIKGSTLQRASGVSTAYRYFSHYLGSDTYALYQTTTNNPNRGMLICDNITYNNSGYGDEGYMNCYAFHVYPDGIYAVLHSGGGVMGSESIHYFSSDTGAHMLTRGRIESNILVSNGYVYYTSGAPFFANTTYRLSLAEALTGSVTERRIGQAGFNYGYVILAFEDGSRSGGASGMCIVGNYLYTNIYPITQGDPKLEDMFYGRVDLRTMKHEKLLDMLVRTPRLGGSWIYFTEFANYKGTFLRMRPDGSEREVIAQGLTDYYFDGDDFLFYQGKYQERKLIWNRYALTNK